MGNISTVYLPCGLQPGPSAAIVALVLQSKIPPSSQPTRLPGQPDPENLSARLPGKEGHRLEVATTTLRGALEADPAGATCGSAMQ